MKCSIGLAFLLLTALAAPAFATDLRNSDSKAYKFKFVDGSVTSSKSIRKNGSIYGLCTPNSKCKIILNGKTSMTFDSNAKLKIEGGTVKSQ